MAPPDQDRAAHVFGRLLLTTVHQAPNAPRIDGARAGDAEGRSYGALVLGRGRRTPVIGWRGARVPPPARLIRSVPRPLRPAARWLLGSVHAPAEPLVQSARAGALLRRLADRIDYDHAPRVLSHWFTFEEGEGIRFRDDGRGARLAYLGGEENYRRAHDEADAPSRRVDWSSLATGGTVSGDNVTTALRGFLS